MGFHCLFGFSIFFLLLSHSTVLSRILPETLKTTSVLDVAGSIQTVKEIASLSHEMTAFRLNQQEEQSPASSPLSLKLHSRASVRENEHRDYRTLTLSRLERDSARVRSLVTRLGQAVNGASLADLMAKTTTAEIEGPVVSGTSQGSGEYFSRVGIGNPPRQVYMVIDTGSDVNWLQCAPCADCYQQADPIFDPLSSSSYAPLSCFTPECKALDVSDCRNQSCLYEVSYGDGSYTVGDFVTETLTIGSASVEHIAIGCGHSNEGLFVGAAGLLGLGGGLLSLPSQLNATSFSYCLVDRDSDSASTLEFGSSLPPNTVVAPLLRNHQFDTFYYLGLTGISVGGGLLPIPESAFQMTETGTGGIIIDSGTAVTRLQTEIYNSLRDSFVKGTPDLPTVSGVALFDTCYDLSGKTKVEVPTVALHFPGGRMLPLPAKNCLIPVDSKGTFCLAFAPTASSLAIIGNVQQQGTRVTFDLANSVIAFSSNKC
ncbi:PREDICTED: protein ASPARTIC PROTEASE IN GUARD CELL 1-like [Tarenaya hassleriana]|uniref:protein ASPARTIC PROTEASE IN GUARD CELL 1-like n=1 Tax=Tarenaya hassleriana TaxID=28532 RepID=UPI00053C8201|nr:PREDICTED: protein ASPARTIC PROTEASE IN GUARD CELL 1-like [Tarenaya hassleriana]